MANFQPILDNWYLYNFTIPTSRWTGVAARDWQHLSDPHFELVHAGRIILEGLCPQQRSVGLGIGDLPNQNERG